MLKELKETIKALSYQIDYVNKEIEIIKRKQTNRNSGVEKFNNWNENSLQWFKIICEQAEERIDKFGHG